VGGEGWPRLVGGDVLDHHDDTARLAKVRRGRLRDEEAALRRGPEGELPVGFGHVQNVLGGEALAGSVDEQVEAAEL